MLEVTAIQRLCIQDGPGIRTTVFLKGCSLDCPWCCNPETKLGMPDRFKEGTPVAIRYSTDELFDKLVADRAYYGRIGGVTFSGGEPLLQTESLLPLLRRLREAEIGICIESSLYVPFPAIRQIDPYVDFYLVDIKLVGHPFLHARYNRTVDFEENLSYIRTKIATLRMVLIAGMTDQKENIERLRELQAKYLLPAPEFLQYHTLGIGKGIRLGVQQTEFAVSDRARVDEILALFPGSTYSKI
ncbi:MAG: 4Fe-4S cluster-binding domain-containing protein [Rikenella sp.]|nr:4Fe-4S cluster-binding domain-containing protein [Rikenella sp.]